VTFTTNNAKYANLKEGKETCRWYRNLRQGSINTAYVYLRPWGFIAGKMKSLTDIEVELTRYPGD
jgi:hypothetical protein